MSVSIDQLDPLAKEIAQIAQTHGFPAPRGWGDETQIMRLIGLIGGERQEAMRELMQATFDVAHYCEELADTVIYTLALAYDLSLALDEAIPAHQAIDHRPAGWSRLRQFCALTSLVLVEGEMILATDQTLPLLERQRGMLRALCVEIKACYIAAHREGEDLSPHLLTKIEKNRQRPPLHGNRVF